MYWKLHDKRKRLAASLKGYLDGLPPETRRRIVLGMFAAFAVLALYTFGRAVYDMYIVLLFLFYFNYFLLFYIFSF